MTITGTITKLRLAIAVLAPATTAVAFHVFDDVPDDKFYAAPVEWAFDNGITTGRSLTIFDPLAPVTRGESVTFLNRYDTNIVQPALDAIPAGPAGPQGVAGTQDPTFDNIVPVTSTTHTEVGTLVVDSGATRDIALTANVYLELSSSATGRYVVELRTGDCTGAVVGGTFWRPPASDSFQADAVTITGFALDAASVRTFALCVRKFDDFAVNLVASHVGIVAAW